MTERNEIKKSLRNYRLVLIGEEDYAELYENETDKEFFK